MRSSNLLLKNEDTYKYLLQFLDAKSFLALSRTSKRHYNQNKQFADEKTQGKEIRKKLSVLALSILNNTNKQVIRRNKKLETTALTISVPMIAMRYLTIFAISYVSMLQITNNEMIAFVFALTSTATYLTNVREELRRQNQTISSSIDATLFAPSQKQKSMKLVELTKNQNFLTLRFK